MKENSSEKIYQHPQLKPIRPEHVGDQQNTFREQKDRVTDARHKHAKFEVSAAETEIQVEISPEKFASGIKKLVNDVRASLIRAGISVKRTILEKNVSREENRLERMVSNDHSQAIRFNEQIDRGILELESVLEEISPFYDIFSKELKNGLAGVSKGQELSDNPDLHTLFLQDEIRREKLAGALIKVRSALLEATVYCLQESEHHSARWEGGDYHRPRSDYHQRYYGYHFQRRYSVDGPDYLFSKSEVVPADTVDPLGDCIAWLLKTEPTTGQSYSDMEQVVKAIRKYIPNVPSEESPQENVPTTTPLADQGENENGLISPLVQKGRVETSR